MTRPHQVDLFGAVKAPQYAPSDASPKPPQVLAEAPPAISTPAPTAPGPWDRSTAPSKGLNFQPETLLHAKMNWVCDNVPKMSRLRILRDGAMAECDRLIALHYKG